MISKTLLSLALFAACATIIMSYPQIVPLNEPPQIPDEAKEVILDYIAEKMDQAFPYMGEEIQARANLFNLSAYLNTNRPNSTALTFVPLITLLSGVFSGR